MDPSGVAPLDCKTPGVQVTTDLGFSAFNSLG